MSVFDWFTSKQPAKTATVLEHAGLGHADATLPRTAPASPAANRKIERLERRELIYSVVRDAMIRAGLLAASYKFKVLSLDARGRQFIIMIDLVNQAAGDGSRLAEIEAMMAQTAKMRHDILVTAVYWRVTEQVAVGLSQSPTVAAPQPPAKPLARPTIPAGVPPQAHRYEPLQQDEVAAFKRALASATPTAPLSGVGQIVTSGRRNPVPAVEFQDTQMVDPDRRASPLSGTQYGDLN